MRRGEGRLGRVDKCRTIGLEQHRAPSRRRYRVFTIAIGGERPVAIAPLGPKEPVDVNQVPQRKFPTPDILKKPRKTSRGSPNARTKISDPANALGPYGKARISGVKICNVQVSFPCTHQRFEE